MNTRYLEDEDLDTASSDREISLGATTLLGIFLLLALICAVFFGFGYTMGRRSTPVAAAATTNSVEATTLKTTGAAKPAPGFVPAAKASDEPDTVSADNSDSSVQLPQPVQAPSASAESHAQQKPQPAPVTAAKSSANPPAPITPPDFSKAAAPPAPAHTVGTAVQSGPPALVQVAAVSHQEDADILLNALKRRGYEVAVRHEPQDKLLHIQIGPFASRKDADDMRKRLLSDGYNAIVK